MSRLGVVLSTATEAPAKEFVRLGQVAEEKGFDAILVNEGRGDALACAEAIALGTTRIKVGSALAITRSRARLLVSDFAEPQPPAGELYGLKDHPPRCLGFALRSSSSAAIFVS